MRKTPSAPREGRGEEFYASCDYVKLVNTHTPTMVSIEFTTPYGERRHLFFHFEADGQTQSGGVAAGYRLLSLASSARNVAIAKRLVRFFGGRVIYQDCSSKTFMHPDMVSVENPINAANDGQPYFRMQKALADIKPLSQEEIEACIKQAAYDYNPADVCDKGFAQLDPAFTANLLAALPLKGEVYA